MSDIPKKDTIIVGYNRMYGDKPVLIIGRQLPGKPMEIINVFSGDRATELYQKLVTKENDI